MASSEAKAMEQETVKKKKNEGLFGCVRVVYNFIANKVLVRVVRNKIMQRMRSLGSNIGNGGGTGTCTDGKQSSEDRSLEVDEESSKLAISTFRAREEEIEKRKMEVKEKVELQLGRAEEETRRLAHIWEELEEMADPLRKEVANVRKRIDLTNRELKPLGLSCQKKEKEYKELLDMFNEKTKEKAQLVTALSELMNESERLRMQKLEELSKHSEKLQ